MPRTAISSSLALLALATGSSALPAQQAGRPADPVLVWGTVGLGGGTPDGFAASAGLDLLARGHLISLRAAGVAGIIDDEFWDVAAMYGRAHAWRRGLVALSTGLAIMDGNRCAGVFGGCVPVAARIGLPLAARLSLHPLPFLGVGLYGFANLNSEESFGGAVVTVQLGRLR
jgi:hypothetical protein